MNERPAVRVPSVPSAWPMATRANVLLHLGSHPKNLGVGSPITALTELSSCQHVKTAAANVCSMGLGDVFLSVQPSGRLDTKGQRSRRLLRLFTPRVSNQGRWRPHCSVCQTLLEDANGALTGGMYRPRLLD